MAFFPGPNDPAQGRDDTTLAIALCISAGLMLFRACGAIIFYGVGFSILAMAVPVVAGAAALILQRANLARPAYAVGLYAIFKAGGVGTPFRAVMCYNIGRGFPLIDDKLVEADALLGFHWIACLNFFDAHAPLNIPLQAAYDSIYWQPTWICVGLLLLRMERVAAQLLTALIVGLTFTTIIAVFTPAYDAYHYFNITAAMHPHLLDIDSYDGTKATLNWLRKSTWEGPIPTFHGGMITFPSFHTAAALLFIWYSRESKLLLVPAVVLNTTMLISTPLHGSHHLIDLLAGALVAMGAVAVTDSLCGGRREVRKQMLRAPPPRLPEFGVTSPNFGS